MKEKIEPNKLYLIRFGVYQLFTINSLPPRLVSNGLKQQFISEKNHWMLNHHGIFQGYYFFDHLGLDKNMRDRFKGHDYFEYTAQFCHLYDQCAFDPSYKSMSLDDFEPMVHRVLSKPKNSIYKH